MPLSNRFHRSAPIHYEAQPTRMFGSYSVTAKFADGSSDAVGYGALTYCVAEAERLNAQLRLNGSPPDDAESAAAG